MSSLSKIEGILSALGYDHGTIGEIKVSDENDILSISFKITKAERKAVVADPVEQKEIQQATRKLFNERMQEMRGDSNPLNKARTFQELCESGSTGIKYDPEKNKVVEEKPRIIFSDEAPKKKGRWKTSTPRVMLRNVYFQSYEGAKKFANEYERDFEYTYAQTKGKASLDKFTITKNTDCDELYKKGYRFLLKFRMNGKIFDTLEGVENLKRPEKGSKTGTHCVRYKEE